jgi:hypothetical protein
MREDGRGGWVLLRLSHTTLWLPERDADELAVDLTAVHVAPACARGWEPGALVPVADRWHGVRGRGDPWSARVAFRGDRDVALVKWSARRRLHRGRRRLSRVGPIDRYIGVGRDVPGMTTQTMRGRNGLRLGLHLDNWDGLPQAQRGSSRNRVSLNLGREPRWFMFVDHDLVSAHSPDAIPNTASARSVIARAAVPPAVVRVRVPVGWGYIAPTEILLHDVWSLKERRGAFHASALGRFSPTRGVAEPRVVGIDVDVSVGRPAGNDLASAVPSSPGTDDGAVVARVEGA